LADESENAFACEARNHRDLGLQVMLKKAHNFPMVAAYVVFASKDGESELWAASGTPGEALAAVRSYLPSGWLLTLTGESLSTEMATSLGVSSGDVRQLSGTHFDHAQSHPVPRPALAR
jgi:hypothetical protein